ncbi:MAG: GAF and ANTAR domain-containing protein [Pseudomonadota bacterium]
MRCPLLQSDMTVMENVSLAPYRMHFDELMTFSHEIVAEKYLEDILQLIVMVAANVADIDICLLWLMDNGEHPERLLLKASHGIDTGLKPEVARAMSEGRATLIAARETPLILPDFPAEVRPEEKAIAEKCGLHSMLGLPLRASGGSSAGALICFTTRFRDFTKEEIDRMSAVVATAAITIRNTELMVKTRVAMEELETQALVGKAREVLMRRQGIGEDEAWRRLRHYSKESLESPRRVAETILLSEN